jgi:pimeloyl-ACP methyl ester carboxylesterase
MRTQLIFLCAAMLEAGTVTPAAWRQSPGASGKPAASAARPVARAASLEGEWSGVLEVGDASLHLVLHLSKDPQGGWHAKLDSVDQAVYGIEASHVNRGEDTLSFELASVGAKFQGKILPGHQAIRGVWEQSGTGLPLKFEKRTAGDSRALPGAVSPAEGTWQGAIEVGNMRMRLQLHVAHADKGQLVASIDSLDQGIQGIPASKVSESAGQLRFEISVFRAEYRGTLNATKNGIQGVWTQNDTEEPLNFERSERVLDLRRPQNPVKPYPYREEEISLAAGEGKAVLAGTLDIPEGNGPFPAAVLIGGSGPNDRDEAVAGHKPFWVLADFLTRRGMMVLRYDKRGCGRSTGVYEQAAMQDFVQDAQAALSYLQSRKEVDPRRLGLVGHGEGGILGAQLAARSSDVKWLVLLASPATTGERTLLRQSELVARTGGLAEEQIARSQEFDRLAYAAVREVKESARLETRLHALVEKSGLGASMPPQALEAQLRLMTSPSFREFLDYDPEPALERLICPVLALNGDRDLQVNADENVPLLRKAYETSGNRDFTVMEIEGVNHLFQKAQSGSPALYGAIEETVAPEVLKAMESWLAKYSICRSVAN